MNTIANTNLMVINHLQKWLFFLLLIITSTFTLSGCTTTLSNRICPTQSLTTTEPPSEDIVSCYITSNKGVKAFSSKYWSTETHKAFASSDDGSWGYCSGKSRKEYAVLGAIKYCEEHLKPQDSPCKIVNIDGIWIPLQQGDTMPTKIDDMEK